jgi:hypothetical protein
VAYSDAVSLHSPGSTEKKHENHQNNWCPLRNSNRVYPEQEAEAIPPKSTCPSFLPYLKMMQRMRSVELLLKLSSKYSRATIWSGVSLRE